MPAPQGFGVAVVGGGGGVGDVPFVLGVPYVAPPIPDFSSAFGVVPLFLFLPPHAASTRAAEVITIAMVFFTTSPSRFRDLGERGLELATRVLIATTSGNLD